MSNLLKKSMEPEIETFGFPLIDDGQGMPHEEEKKPEPEPNPEETAVDEAPPAEPEVSLEDTYRRRLLELERQAQDVEKDAYAKGFAQGERDGLEYGQKTIQVIKNQLERQAENLESLPEKIFEDYRNWLVAVSMKIARHIVNQELRISPEAVGSVVQALLGEAAENTSLTVYLNPLDLEFMEKRADLVIAPKGKRFTLKPDNTLGRGGCRVENDIQLLDSSIETRFELLDNYLADANESGPVSDEKTDEQ